MKLLIALQLTASATLVTSLMTYGAIQTKHRTTKINWIVSALVFFAIAAFSATVTFLMFDGMIEEIRNR